MNILRRSIKNQNQAWYAPYLIGALIGLTCVGAFVLFARLPGVSGCFLTAANGLSMVFAHTFTQPFGWFPLGFMIAVIIGSFLSALLFHDWQKERVPGLWKRTFGASLFKRSIFAFIGGVILMVGAHIADGCTVGKAISMGMQLDLSAWIFVIAVFVAGIITSFMLYKPWRWKGIS